MELVKYARHTSLKKTRFFYTLSRVCCGEKDNVVQQRLALSCCNVITIERGKELN